jgi:sugar phosphate isomerase/epimerase
MKIGVSSYSLSRAIVAKQLTIIDAISWIVDNGGQHIEIVPIGFDLVENPQLIEAIRSKASDLHVDISNYAIGANFALQEEAAYEQEINRVMKQVDIANGLGVKLMRHDVATSADTSIQQFLDDLPRLAQACQRIADYASQFGITTSVENHGYYIQASDRIQALIHAVNRPNFRSTLDIGNFMCVDEDPLVATMKNLSYASMVHLKDFYLRPAFRNPGSGWFTTAGGNYLKGAIVGHGDIDMWEVLRRIKQSGYDGYLSIEFEGMEDCQVGTKLGLDNALNIWNHI